MATQLNRLITHANAMSVHSNAHNMANRKEKRFYVNTLSIHYIQMDFLTVHFGCTI